MHSAIDIDHSIAFMCGHARGSELVEAIGGLIQYMIGWILMPVIQGAKLVLM